MTFSFPGLSENLCRAADELGYREPFPVQREVIPFILAGRDLAVIAQTGSGKTAAFLLPILQLISESSVKKSSSVRILILVPTRELAVQVVEASKFFSRYLVRRIKTAVVLGGVSINLQMKELGTGREILVATPGRLLDLADKNAVRLSSVEILVIDEADKMFDLGFGDEISRVLALLPEKRQNLLFSATFRREMDVPGMNFLHDAVKIGFEEPGPVAEPVEQIVYSVEQNSKGVLLRHLIKDGEWNQVLLFVSSKRKADNVARKLNSNGITAEAIHGDKSQGARTGALTRFKNGEIRVLVATDLVSRGIDIKQLPYVVNYELPRSPVDYIHRIGRTGRAGKPGVAITLVSPEDEQHMKLIEKKTGIKPLYIDSTEIVF